MKSLKVIEKQECFSGNKAKGLTSWQIIYLSSAEAAKCLIALRRIGYKDLEACIQYLVPTNSFRLAAGMIAVINEARWQNLQLFQFNLFEQRELLSYCRVNI
jgi:hypothetical protein